MLLVSPGWILNCTYSFTIACLLAFNDIGCSSVVGIYNGNCSENSDSSNIFCMAELEDEYYINCTISPVSFCIVIIIIIIIIVCVCVCVCVCVYECSSLLQLFILIA